MINGRKTIGLFLSGITGDLQKGLCKAMYNSAKEHGYDAIFINFVGIIGADYADYAYHEEKLLDVIPFDRLDGAVFDNNNTVVPHVREKIRRRLIECKCPVIAIGDPIDDFVQIHFNNSDGIAEMVRHFTKDHGITDIGYMSGPKDHPDAQARLSAFRNAMHEEGLPEDGVGVYYGDFWYNKGEDAADYFFRRCETKPRAVICANDFMAIALVDSLSAKGINCPQDVFITGFDDVAEARVHIPPITTVHRDEKKVASAAFEMFDAYYNGDRLTDEKGNKRHLILPTDNIYSVSCGCETADKSEEVQDKNAAFHKNVSMLYYIYDTEAAMLEMNHVSHIEQMGDTFARYSRNIGGYSKFFLMAYTDERGRHSYETEMEQPTQKVYPAVWIDHTGTSVRPGGCISTDQFLPVDTSEEPYCYYISHIHFGEHSFGYSAIMMEGDEPFNDFYNLWTVNIAISLETLLQRNIVRSLVSDLEIQSTHDRLTGMLNRRGFEESSGRMFAELASDRGNVMTAVMIDMDRLKYINDIFGHSEGDLAIKAVGDAILSSCGEGDISGRTGGDEFYIIISGKGEDYAEGIVSRVRKKLEQFNKKSKKIYEIDVSCGIYSSEIGSHTGIEEFLRESDEMMYVEKRRKNAQRKA